MLTCSKVDFTFTAKANPFDRGSRTEVAGNLGEQAYQQIRAGILFYQLPPGSRIYAGCGSATTEAMNMRASDFALRLQPSLLQMRTAKWFADRIAAANPKAGAQLIRVLSRGGREKPRKGDVMTRATKKRRRGSTAGSAKPKDLIKYLQRAPKVAPVAGDERDL